MKSELQIRWLAIGLVMAFAVALFWSSFETLVGTWLNSADFSHGILIYPISIWLLWKDKDKAQPGPFAYWGIALLVLVGFGWLLGEITRTTVVKDFAFVCIFPIVVLIVNGLKFTKANLFALAFTFFTLPFGEFLVPPLMEQTATVTVFLLRESGIPIYREGMHFNLPTGSWSVVDACSGLRYLIASFVLASLFCYLNFKSWKKRWIFLISSLVLSVVANWFRAYSVVLVGHLSRMKYGVGDDHVWYGWVFYGLMMMTIFWVGRKFADDPATLDAPALSPDSQTMPAPTGVARSRLAGLALVTCLAMVLWPLVDHFLPKTIPLDKTQVLSLSGQNARPIDHFYFPTGFEDPMSTTILAYDGGAEARIDYFADQQNTHDLFAYGNRLISLDSTVVRQIDLSKTISLQIPSPKYVNSAVTNQAGRDYMVLYWYEVGAYTTHNPYVAKAARALSILLGRGDHSAAVMLAVPMDGANWQNPADYDRYVAKLVPYVEPLHSAMGWRTNGLTR